MQDGAAGRFAFDFGYGRIKKVFTMNVTVRPYEAADYAVVAALKPREPLQGR